MLFDRECRVASVVETHFRALGYRVQVVRELRPLPLAGEEIVGAVVSIDQPVAVHELTFVQQLRSLGLNAPVVALVLEQAVSGLLIDELCRCGFDTYLSLSHEQRCREALELLVRVLLDTTDEPGPRR